MLLNAVYDLEQYTWALDPLARLLYKRGHKVINSRVCPAKNADIQATLAIQAPSGFRNAVGKKVWISHGISCTKGWGPPQDIDIYIAPGPYWVEALAKHAKENPDRKPFQVWMTGWPKSDVLMNLHRNYEAVKKEVYAKMHFDKDRPLVGYYPTYIGGHHAARNNNIEDVLKGLRNYYNVAAVRHQMERAKPKQEFDRAGCYQKMDFFKLKMFSVCDVLISDTSSMVYEFLAFNRPIILLNNTDDPAYLHVRHLLSEPKLDMGFETNIENLMDTVKYVLKNPLELEQKRFWWRNWVFGPVDGNCSLRVAQALEKEFNDVRG